MMDYRGYVAEATGANVFFVDQKGTLHTPIADCFLNGITRQSVIGILEKAGVEVIERHIELPELENFEQCWLTGTAAEVTPVGQIDQFNFQVGELAKQVANEYEKEVRS